VDHKELLKALDPEVRAALTRKSDRAGIKRLCAHFGWILVLGCYVAVGAPLWGLALVPLGICIVFLFTLLHETVHFTPFENARLNGVVGHICSILVIVPNTWFRYFHLTHHKYTNDALNDPELDTPKPESFGGYVAYLSGLPYWRSTAVSIWRQAKGEVSAPYLPERSEAAVVWQARALIALYSFAVLLVLLGWSWIFWCWILPLVLGQPFLRAYLLAEHGLCPPVANMFENTRTTFTNRIIRFLAWNMPYHAEHHAYPAVPFYKLPQFHRLAKEQLVSTSQGYAAFHKDYAKSVVD
jgi:fatty acid desaturase